LNNECRKCSNSNYILFTNRSTCSVRVLSHKFDSPPNDRIHLCLFIYSSNAFSNSSLILRVEPVLFTTNFIHSVHACLSIFIDVFVFVLPSTISFTIPCAVNKVNGVYHNLNIQVYGIIVWRYDGNNGVLGPPCDLSQYREVEL
jgi:hypothetical protein